MIIINLPGQELWQLLIMPRSHVPVMAEFQLLYLQSSFLQMRLGGSSWWLKPLTSWHPATAWLSGGSCWHLGSEFMDNDLSPPLTSSGDFSYLQYHTPSPCPVMFHYQHLFSILQSYKGISNWVSISYKKAWGSNIPEWSLKTLSQAK